MSTVIAWLFFPILPPESLEVKYISAEVIDIQTIDDGKGDKRNIVVRYEGKQMMFQTDDLNFVDEIQGFVCVKEWQGASIPQGQTPRYQALAMPSNCVGTDAAE